MSRDAGRGAGGAGRRAPSGLRARETGGPRPMGAGCAGAGSIEAAAGRAGSLATERIEPRARRRGLAGWLLAALALWVGSAAAQVVESAEWDGLSRWVAAMRAGAITVEAPAAVDLGAVAPGSGLALLDPAAGEVDGLRLFVQEGGRVLLAVEDPVAEPLLAAFGLSLAAAPAAAGDTGHPALRAFAVPGGGLFTGVGTLLANHPAALAGPAHLDPAVSWPDGTAFGYHLKLGEGELVAVGDASLFINLMLDGGGNARFASNLGAWLGRDGAAVYVVGPEGRVEGRYGAGGEGAPMTEGLNAALGELGRLLDPDDLVLHLLLATLLAATLVYVVAVFPGGGPVAPGASAAPMAGRAERSAGGRDGPAAPEGSEAFDDVDDGKAMRGSHER